MATHQKRVAAPISWPVTRKTYHWVVGVNPGAHSTETGIPLLVVVRDILKIANNAREAKRIINEKNICIDGVVRTDYKYMVGLFDIISLPATNEYYRVLFDSKNRFKLFKEDANAGKNMVAISNESEFETIEEYVYVIGETTPQIKVV